MNIYFGFLFVVLAAFGWGMVGVLARFLFVSGMEPAEVAFWRTVFGCILFSAAGVASKKMHLRASKDIFGFMAFGVVCLASLFLCSMASVREGGVALTVVLQYTAPAWVVLISRVLFSESITRAKCIAVLLSLTGVAIVSFSGSGGSHSYSLYGICLALLSGLLYALHIVGTKKLVTSYPSFAIFGYGFFFAALTLFPFVNFVDKSPADWGILFILGFLCTFAPFFLYAIGLKYMEASTASITSTCEPVITTVAAWLIWNENLGLHGIFGMFLIISAVLILIIAAAPTTFSQKKCRAAQDDA